MVARQRTPSEKAVDSFVDDLQHRDQRSSSGAPAKSRSKVAPIKARSATSSQVKARPLAKPGGASKPRTTRAAAPSGQSTLGFQLAAPTSPSDQSEAAPVQTQPVGAEVQTQSEAAEVQTQAEAAAVETHQDSAPRAPPPPAASASSVIDVPVDDMLADELEHLIEGELEDLVETDLACQQDFSSVRLFRIFSISHVMLSSSTRVIPSGARS